MWFGLYMWAGLDGSRFWTTEKGFGWLVSMIGVSDFEGVLEDGEGERDWVCWRWRRSGLAVGCVLDDREGLAWNHCRKWFPFKRWSRICKPKLSFGGKLNTEFVVSSSLGSGFGHGSEEGDKDRWCDREGEWNWVLLETIRTYVIHLLGTYVTILCNWLILWQNALYLYLGRSRMCLILQETLF